MEINEEIFNEEMFHKMTQEIINNENQQVENIKNNLLNKKEEINNKMEILKDLNKINNKYLKAIKEYENEVIGIFPKKIKLGKKFEKISLELDNINKRLFEANAYTIEKEV